MLFSVRHFGKSMKKISVHYQHIFSAILLLSVSRAFPLDYTKAGSSLADAFYNTAGAHEGTTSFRSLLIPSGGRAESLGSAYTALSDDISFIDYNPAASALLNETERVDCRLCKRNGCRFNALWKPRRRRKTKLLLRPLYRIRPIRRAGGIKLLFGDGSHA